MLRGTRPARWWTPERLAELRRLADRGYSVTECAEALGKTRGSVAGMAHWHGIHFDSRRRKAAGAPGPGHSALSNSALENPSFVNAGRKA